MDDNNIETADDSKLGITSDQVARRDKSCYALMVYEVRMRKESRKQSKKRKSQPSQLKRRSDASRPSPKKHHAKDDLAHRLDYINKHLDKLWEHVSVTNERLEERIR